jgi:flagellar basal-body rod protein FlgB
MNLDKLFGVHAQAAQLRSFRGEVLANNIANSETPNYKARDIDFKSVLKQASGVDQVSLGVSNKNHIGMSTNETLSNDLLYRMPSQPSLDGNTVDMDIEKAEFSNNAMSYQVSMTFLGGKVKGIMSAIRGE